MKSDQELISESRNLLNLIINEPNVLKYRQYIEEFIEKYETWPSLTEVVSSLDPKRKNDKKRLGTLEKKALKEIQYTFDQLIKEYGRKQINIPQGIIDDYEQRITSSAGYTVSRFGAVRDLIFLLEEKGELSIIKKFVSVDPKGTIYECTFSPSYLEWHQERDVAKKSSWYSYDQITYLKNNPSSLLFIEDYPLRSDDESDIRVLVQNAYSSMVSFDPQETMKKYTLCVKTVHEYAKENGLLTKNGIKVPFKRVQLREDVRTLFDIERGLQLAWRFSGYIHALINYF